MDKLALIFDGNNLVQRAHHAHRKFNPATKEMETLTRSDGLETGALYGSIVSFATYVRRLKPTHVLWTFDWGKSQKRLDLDPEYKANRVSSGREALSPQFGAFERFLSLVDASHFRMKDVEADDLMVQAAGMFKGVEIPCTIVTADHDLRQVVQEGVTVLKPSMGRSANAGEKIFTVKNTEEYYGIAPDRLAEVWALCGDSGDNIIGVPRVGYKTALKMINQHGDLLKVLESGDKKILGYEEQVKKNYELIVLDTTESHKLPLDPVDCAFTPQDSEALRDFLDEFELNSITNRLEEGTLW